MDVNAPQTQYNPTTGETISLTCVITSGTATQVRWYKNNKLVIMAANLRLSGGNANTPSLTITQVQLTDAGSYICEATDGSATRNTTTITVSPKGSIQFLCNVDVWISLFLFVVLRSLTRIQRYNPPRGQHSDQTNRHPHNTPSPNI